VGGSVAKQPVCTALKFNCKKKFDPKNIYSAFSGNGKTPPKPPPVSAKNIKNGMGNGQKKSLTGITDGPSSKDGRACSANTVNDYAQKCNQLCFFVGFQGMGSILKGDRKGGKILRNS